MISVKHFINFDEFSEFETINQSKSTIILTSQKHFSPSQKYLFKQFQFDCYSSKYQKIILDTFNNIRKKDCQYLQSYNYLSFFFKSSSQPTFSMKFKTSKTLDQVLKSPDLFSKMKIEDILHCLFAVSEGLSYLHNNLICHGNLCPSNIIIDDLNQFYLIDFGLYPIKKLYIKEDELFNKDYKDPYMKYNHPTFATDIYSFGVLMCEIFMIYLKSINKIKKDETLQNFLNNFKLQKFDFLPSFYADLIKSCLNSITSERPSFSQIIQMFKNEKQQFFGINVQQLYEDFINSDYLLNLAEKNDSNALNKIGRMYEKGKKVEKNLQKALNFYEKAAVLDNAEAQNNYGVLLQEINGDNEDDMKKGADYLRLSAEQGNIYGMANYGLALLNGDGIKKNFQKAGEYIQKSADLGYSYAQLYYGNMLLDNSPSVSAINEGLEYIKKAMNQNNSDAFVAFASLLQEGKFIEKNIDLAMKYLKIAADMGNEDAIIDYAEINLNITPKNEKVALKYYQIAFDNGNATVKNIIDELKEKLEGPTINKPKKAVSVPKKSTNLPNKVTYSSKKSIERSIFITTPFYDKPKGKKSRKLELLNEKLSEEEDYDNDNDMNFMNDNLLINKSYMDEDKYIEIKRKLNNNIPITINQIKLISLGEIVYDRANYHSPSYIYPVGYQIEREYQSISNPNEKTICRGTILDGGESPIFQVECLDESKMVFQGINPTNPWSQLRSAVENKKACYPGTIAFGFQYDTVLYLIERLANANRCANYIFKFYFPKKTSNNVQMITDENNEKIKEVEEKEKEGKKIHQVKNKETSNEESTDSLDTENKKDICIINIDQPIEQLVKQGDFFYEKNDLANALKCYKEAVKQGKKDLLFTCAELCLNFNEKLEYLEEAIKENIPKAFSKWRIAIMKRIYLTKNKEDFSQLARKLESYQDFSDAAIIYSKSKDIINSQICYEKAKMNIDDIKDGYQQYDFACFMINKKDYELVEVMLKKASQNDHSGAILKLKKISLLNKQQVLNEADSLLQKGISFYEGTNGNKKDTKKALELFEKASKLNCPKADFYIGLLKDNDDGLKYIIKSAEHGDHDGLNRYAHYLKHGILVKKDNDEAMKYYKLAADKGNAEASFEYGREKYEEGLTDDEKEEGMKYIKKSAEALYPDALYMYSKISKELNAEDSDKFIKFAIEKGSQLALSEEK